MTPASDTLPLRIGTAGWSLDRKAQESLGGVTGSQLERYASRFSAVEINSSFYRPHRPTTYARWAAATPASFRFSVKLPRTISHDARLSGAEDLLARFIGEVSHLGDRLGALLLQLPPSLALDITSAGRFLESFRTLHQGPLVIEPRHGSWFGEEGVRLCRQYDVARAAVDPPPHPDAATPSGSGRIAYYRWHGAPRMYWSNYGESELQSLADRLRGGNCWCIFDNTAQGHAFGNASRLMALAAETHQRAVQ